METRSAKKRRLMNIASENESDHRHEEDSSIYADRISDLPDAVIQNILFLLPIDTIAQTSVLSKRWRFIWSTFPDLDFTTLNPIDTVSPTKLQSSYSRGMDFIAQVLTRRNKHSDLRLLKFRSRLSFSRLTGLIRSAIRHNVQELDIEVATDDYFNFPRAVLASESLRIFKLKSCYPGFRLPPSSVMTGGFKTLLSLSLSLVILYNQPSLLDMFSDTSFPLLKKLNLHACFGLTHLTVRCKSLEDLTLEKCFQLQGLEIAGPKLERARIASCFDAVSGKSWVKINGSNLKNLIWEYNAITDSIILENLNSLQEAYIGFFVLDDDVNLNASKLQSVHNLLSGISHVHCSTFESQCIEFLSNTNYCAVYLNPFNNLKSLELHASFKRNNVLGLAYLFRSSPTLHTLTLKIIDDYKIERREWYWDFWKIWNTRDEHFWESQRAALKCFLENLKVVKIHGFVERENELSLAKFLLKYGKGLEEMTLCIGNRGARDSLRRQKLRSQMMGLSWASSNAKLEFQ